MPPKTREIIYTTPFKKDIKRLKPKIKRLTEFIEGAEEILARQPERGKRTKRSKVYAVTFTNLEGNPPTALYYCFTKDHVIFIMLRTEGDKRPDMVFL